MHKSEVQKEQGQSAACFWGAPRVFIAFPFPRGFCSFSVFIPGRLFQVHANSAGSEHLVVGMRPALWPQLAAAVGSKRSWWQGQHSVLLWGSAVSGGSGRVSAGTSHMCHHSCVHFKMQINCLP